MKSIIREGCLPIPEPSSYVLMPAGFGLVGFMARRKKSNRWILCLPSTIFSDLLGISDLPGTEGVFET
ncbi:PEP-CTERM sorting domain-containing protein [Nitrosospira sp. NpAV]|uniref:PEP-CTERM sorting domain-containing protein n=1 Tax=Nitrosospira sp. NpAV TaxID=58133 RepID=UPI000A0482F6